MKEVETQNDTFVCRCFETTLEPTDTLHMQHLQQIAATSFPHQQLYSGGITLWNHLLTFHLCNMIYIDAFSQGLTAAVVAKMSSYAQLSRL